MVLQAQDRSYEKTQRDQQRDSRRCHAGTWWAGRGPSWRIRARWVGSTLQRFRHGAEDGGGDGEEIGVAVGPQNVRKLRLVLAVSDRQSVHRGARQHAEIRSFKNFGRTAPVEELDLVER